MCPRIRTGLFMASQGSHAFKETITATGDKTLLPAENVILEKISKEFLTHALGDNMFKTAKPHMLSPYLQGCVLSTETSANSNAFLGVDRVDLPLVGKKHESIVAKADRMQSCRQPCLQRPA